MKREIPKWWLWLLLLFIATCGPITTNPDGGGSSGSGSGKSGDDEETEDSPQAGPPSAPAEIPSNLGSLVEKAGSALVSDFQASKFSSDLSLNPAISYVTPSTRFNTFVSTNDGVILTDIFGPNDGNNPDTRIRALLAEAAERIRVIRLFDKNFTCTNTSKLSDQDGMPIAFYGTIANGPASNRYFDCRLSFGTNKVDVYGKDADNVLRIVSMSKSTVTNSRLVERRGTYSNTLITIYTTYHETTTATGKTVFLDLQYVTANLITGPDNSFSSKSDNGYMRVRGRITGQVLFDGSENVTDAKGEFKITADNVEPDNFGGDFTNQYIGRGGFRPSEISIFNIYSTFTEQTVNDAGIYCIQAAGTAGAVPSSIDATNCANLGYETALAWGDVTLPFTPDPTLQSKFVEINFFPANNTDMIADDGSNFTIPTY